MTDPYFIVGPTAVGKSDLALRVAKLCGAEIVSADAFQVYAGLERLTAKPAPAELSSVPHHLVAHVPLEETYNVARFANEAAACLREIAARGLPAIVVGGSGLYVKSLTHGLSALPAAQPGLRDNLDAQDLPALIAQLIELDPSTAATIDRRNRRRVIRALEICLTAGQSLSTLRTSWQSRREPIRGLFIQRSREDLLARIEARVASYLDDEALDQARAALASRFSDTSARIIGLSETRAYLAGELTRANFFDRINIATRRYAKRQLTWFRGETFTDNIDVKSTVDMDTLAQTIAAKVTQA